MLIKIISRLVACILFMLGGVTWLKAQERLAVEKCGTMTALENSFKKNPSLKTKFEKQTLDIQESAKRRKAARTLRTHQTVYVPVVFHIVLTNPSLVTDAQIQAQLDTLNRDFAGLNSDSVNIPAAFKPLFGKSGIQFKLAQRTPGNEPSTGIVRTTTTHASFGINDNSIKYSSLGGDDAWDHDRFFNVWITNLSGGYLGYATFPESSVAAEDGVVISYTSLPGGTPPYNRGRTLTHETGHYFYLYHIWGDEDGCSGTDYVDDTPNQARSTSGCPGGIVRTDACTTTAPGILYEDYMDYTDDECMMMMTKDQVTRMETALDDYRASYYTSNGATPVILFSLDASAKSINTPIQRICNASFTPVISLRNTGSQTLTSADLYASIDNGPATLTHWTGSLATLAETAVTLNTMTTTEGNHVLKVVVTAPNGSTDQNTTNDTITRAFQYFAPVAPPLAESFESSSFPPAGWDIINPDNSYTWERVTGVAKTGNAAVVIRNFNYQVNDRVDYLRLPVMNITSADSAFLTFQLAAAVTSNPNNAGNMWDTLQVMVSTDCGVTYTSLYKKWGSSLITRSTPTSSAFVPTSNEWRKDSVNLTSYINAGPVMLAFVNTTEWENNIYLDDINVYSVAINPNLKEKGFMVTPNPTTGMIAVQFYPNPAKLRGIAIYNSSGIKVAERVINGTPGTYYSFNLGGLASGVYMVQAVFSDRKVTQKVIKR